MNQPNPFNQSNTTAQAGIITSQYSGGALKVLKNTYALLALTLAFSGLTAFVSMSMNMPPLNPFITLIGYFGLLFAVHKTCQSALGLVFIFALTGFMGLTLGPILSMYTATSNGSELVMLALGGTATIFFGLSAFTLITKRDFSNIGKALFVGLLVAFVAAIANIFLQIPALALTVSSLFILLSSGVIL